MVRRRSTKGFELKFKLLLLSFIVLLILFYFSLPDGKTRMIFCDVGQGDGALLTRGTFQMVIDTGPANGMMLNCLSHHMPFWDKAIEVVVLSHPDSDHSGGLTTIKKYYKVDQVWGNEQTNYSAMLNTFDSIRSQWFDFEVVSSGQGKNSNDNSVVGVLTVGNKKLLFTGDASSEVEQRLVWRGLVSEKIDVLKVSHHGSAAGTSEELLEAIKPEWALISVGKNSFGHPTKIVLDRLKNRGIKVWRTDWQGEKVMEL